MNTTREPWELRLSKVVEKVKEFAMAHQDKEIEDTPISLSTFIAHAAALHAREETLRELQRRGYRGREQQADGSWKDGYRTFIPDDMLAALKCPVPGCDFVGHCEQAQRDGLCRKVRP